MADAPSRRLDAPVAEALGWTDVDRTWHYGHPPGRDTWPTIPHYTTDPVDTAPVGEMLAFIFAHKYKVELIYWGERIYSVNAERANSPESRIAVSGQSLGHALGLLVLAVAEG